MPADPRPKNFQDWYNYIDQVTDPASGQIQLTGADILRFRNTCYKEIETIRGRPLFVFVANIFASAGNNDLVTISLQDVDGFTDLINSVPEDTQEVDVLILSPGGYPDATERIVEMLRGRFDQVHFIVPHSAYSAGTMMCMAGDTITLSSNAVLGPIDPQLNGIPARQIKRAFTNLQQKLRDEGQEAIVAYLPLIEKYDLHLLEICDDAEKLSKILVIKWLRDHMLKNLPTNQRNRKSRKATDYMADFDTHLVHSRSLDRRKLVQNGIKIEDAGPELEKLLRESHILLIATFTHIGFAKLYESPDRLSWGRLSIAN